ncbi:MAG: FadR family transcriptional regulator [Planctomycetes bacterium]|nr:FadR family transcriptional regulator [Planctomycetota bacterium]
MVLNRLKEYLEEMQPGDALPGELELSRQFGVSRSNIRESIKHLSELGVLERSTKRGTFVNAPTLEDISRVFAFQLKIAGPGFEELKHARLFLEIAIAPMVIRYATPVVIEKLNELIDCMEECADSPSEADKFDRAFHAEFAHTCGNRLIEIFSQVTSMTFDARYREKFQSCKAVKKSVADHRKMVACIRAGDLEGLKSLIEAHILPL